MSIRYIADNLDRAKKSVTPKKLWMILYGIAALAMAATYLFLCHNEITLWGIGSLIAAEAVLFAFAAALQYADVRNMAPEKLFLLLFVPVSLAMMVAMPIFRAPDEQSHVERVWQISIGQWVPTAENQGIFYQPDNLMDGLEEYYELTLQDIANLTDLELSQELEVSGVGTNTGVYPVNNYIPQAIAMFLVRLFTGNRILILYSARLGAWILSTILFYYAIKKIPAGKYSLIAISLFPMMLQEAASASADALTSSAAFAFLAFILWARTEKKRFSWKDLAVLFLLTHWVSSFKLMYAPLAFLIFMIPEQCFGSRKKKAWLGGGMLALSLLYALGWLVLCKVLYVDTAAPAERLEGNIMRHVYVILENPLGFLVMIVRTFFAEFFRYGSGMLGRGISWHNIFIPDILTALELAAIIGTFVVDQDNRSIRLKHSGVAIVSACAASVIVMFAALFIWWTPYGSTYIGGIQGRYFLPLLPYVILLFKANRSVSCTDSNRRKLVSFLAMVCLCAVYSVFLQTIR